MNTVFCTPHGTFYPPFTILVCSDLTVYVIDAKFFSHYKCLAYSITEFAITTPISSHSNILCLFNDIHYI